MYEAYAAVLVGVVCAGVAILALRVSRDFAPAAYAGVHVAVVVLMIVLVTIGYGKVSLTQRVSPAIVSSGIYVGVSWIMFVNTLIVYSFLNRQKRTERRRALPE